MSKRKERDGDDLPVSKSRKTDSLYDEMLHNIGIPKEVMLIIFDYAGQSALTNTFSVSSGFNALVNEYIYDHPTSSFIKCAVKSRNVDYIESSLKIIDDGKMFFSGTLQAINQSMLPFDLVQRLCQRVIDCNEPYPVEHRFSTIPCYCQGGVRMTASLVKCAVSSGNRNLVNFLDKYCRGADCGSLEFCINSNFDLWVDLMKNHVDDCDECDEKYNFTRKMSLRTPVRHMFAYNWNTKTWVNPSERGLEMTVGFGCVDDESE